MSEMVDLKPEEEEELTESSDFISKPFNQKRIIIIIATIVVAFILIVIYALSAKHTLVLADYATIKVDGYNGHATASVDINLDEIKTRVLKKNGVDSGNFLEVLDYELIIEECFDNVEYTINKGEDISNGDYIEVIFERDNETANIVKDNLGLKIKSGKSSLKVSGLENAIEIDPFEYVDFYFKGPSGYAEMAYSVNIDNNVSKNDYILKKDSSGSLVIEFSESHNNTVYFEVDSEYKNGELVDGEKIVIRAKAKMNGYVLEPDKKECVVSAPSLYSTVSECKSSLEQLSEIAEEKIDNKYLERLEKSYYLIGKSDSAKYTNRVVLIYYCFEEYAAWFGGGRTFYKYIILNDCYTDKDGNARYTNWTNISGGETLQEVNKEIADVINSPYYTVTSG